MPVTLEQPYEDITLEPDPIDKAAATADLIEQMRQEEAALSDSLRRQSAEADYLRGYAGVPEAERPARAMAPRYGEVMPTSSGFMYVGKPSGTVELPGTPASRVAAATAPAYGAPTITSRDPEMARIAARMAVNQLVERGTPPAEALQRFPEFFSMPKGAMPSAPVVPVQVPSSGPGIASYVYNPKTGAVHFQPADKSDVVGNRLRYKYETELLKAKSDLDTQMAREEGMRSKNAIANAQSRIALYTKELGKLDQKPGGVTAPVTPPARKNLDAATARKILSQAGGDKTKARKIAREAGYDI